MTEPIAAATEACPRCGGLEGTHTRRDCGEVELIRKHYGDFAGLYDPSQAVAHVRVLLAEVARLAKERDLAIAHDRQPYPTADAYEAACAAREKHRARADALQSAMATIRDEVFRFGHAAAANLVSEFLARIHGQACDAVNGDIERRNAKPTAWDILGIDPERGIDAAALVEHAVSVGTARADAEVRQAAVQRVLDAAEVFADEQRVAALWLTKPCQELIATVDARRALGHTAPAERVAQAQCPFPGSDGESCLGCGQPWPCRAELIEELERQQDDIERAREVMSSDAYRLATGETCMPGQPAGCGDYHNAGQCVRKSTAPAEGGEADHTPEAQPWHELARRVTASERQYRQLADQCWWGLDVTQALRYRGMADGLELAREHHLNLTAAVSSVSATGTGDAR